MNVCAITTHSDTATDSCAALSSHPCLAPSQVVDFTFFTSHFSNSSYSLSTQHYVAVSPFVPSQVPDLTFLTFEIRLHSCPSVVVFTSEANHSPPFPCPVVRNSSRLPASFQACALTSASRTPERHHKHPANTLKLAGKTHLSGYKSETSDTKPRIASENQNTVTLQDWFTIGTPPILLLLFLFVFGTAVGAVELPHGFDSEILATNLNAATAIAPSPDGRIFIVDQTGKLLLWKEGSVLERPALTLHVTDYWERGLIGMALHPEFPRTPQIFLLYVTDRPFVHHVLSRFTMNGDVADPASEKVLFEGDDQEKLGGTIPAGHQGGPVRFGPDGKIYVALGEQTAGEPSQRLATLQGKILRLNVDGSIPSDNPFFNSATGRYRAIYAYGVRNPFGLATQPETKRMLFTDVGGSAFEEVNELVAGANYGWPRTEGFSTNTNLKQPLHAYSPLVGQSVVGGVFIPRSSAWPEKWRGKLLFGDFMAHWIKALDPDAPTNVVTLARGLNGPVATELAPDGSLLVLNRGAVWRDPKKFVENAGSLVRIRYTGNSPAPPASEIHVRTAALGLPMDANQLPRRITRKEWNARFRDVRGMNIRSWPISIFTRTWQPHVHETARLYLPAGAKTKLLAADQDVVLPAGAVILRDFSVSEAWTDPSSKDDRSRVIETRLFIVGNPKSYGASYRWGNDDSAELSEDGDFTTIRGVADFSENTQVPKSIDLHWWFPPLDESITFPITNPSYWISMAPSDFVLSPREGRPARGNWLLTMLQRGALETALAEDAISAISPGTVWENTNAALETRVRSYLHGNCAVCHQPGTAARGSFDARITTPLDRTGILNGELATGDLGIAGAKVVVPGEPERSILYRRLKATDFFRMPPTQLHNEPSPILPVLEEWIRGLSPMRARIEESPKR